MRTLILESSFDVGGDSQVILPKSQLIFGDAENETSFYVQTEVIVECKYSLSAIIHI